MVRHFLCPVNYDNSEFALRCDDAAGSELEVMMGAFRALDCGSGVDGSDAIAYCLEIVGDEIETEEQLAATLSVLEALLGEARERELVEADGQGRLRLTRLGWARPPLNLFKFNGEKKDEGRHLPVAGRACSGVG